MLNMDQPWTISNWHIRASFRLADIIVPEQSITLPDKPISGPNLAWENKEFPVTITINGKEKATVRCRIRHYTADLTKKIQWDPEDLTRPTKPVFEEFVEKLNALPFPKKS